MIKRVIYKELQEWKNEKNHKPLLIRAGISGRLKSMTMFMEKYNSKIGLKVSQATYSIKNKIISLPFYGIGAYYKNKPQ